MQVIVLWEKAEGACFKQEGVGILIIISCLKGFQCLQTLRHLNANGLLIFHQLLLPGYFSPSGINA